MPSRAGRADRKTTMATLTGEQVAVAAKARSGFYIPHGFEEDFMEPLALQELVGEVMVRHGDKFDQLQPLRIRFLWKRKGGKSAGGDTLSKTAKVGGVARFWGGCEVVVWFAADHCRARNFDRTKMEALIYHELCHIEVDEDGEAVLVGHDLEFFFDEVREYGNWAPGIQVASDLFCAPMELPLE